MHNNCGSRERLWLPASHRVAATAARHPYCIECGTVKNLTLPHAKPLAYYVDALANLKEYLEHSAGHSKLAQVQRHLIAQRLASRSEFEDPYGTPGRVQLEVFVSTVLTVRPDLDEELVLRMLPGRRKWRKRTDSQKSGEKVVATHSRH